MKKGTWFLFASLAIAIGLYPGIYFLVPRQFGLLSTKPPGLLSDPLWQAGFYAHILLGGAAMLVGWTQFSAKWRVAKASLHRQLGKVYVFAALGSAMAGFFVALSATGGLVSIAGFAMLAVIWFATTLMGLLAIRRADVPVHQRWMIFSYAACFAAVTLRIWLPLLIMLHKGEFVPAYRIVAWLCWVPNLLVAGWISRKISQKKEMQTA